VDFLVAKDDLHRCRFLDADPLELEPGQATLRVASFGLTSNNITYAMFGEAMSYWSFFPTEDGWGRVPVWGFAEVSASRQDGLEVGMRVFGYLPPSSEFVLDSARVDGRGFVDSEVFGAGTVVLSSASSKTASALAFLLSRREGIDVVGLTSSRSVDFARGLGVYDHVVSYEEVGELPRERAVYVDMAGDAAVRDTVHEHYREQLAHSAVVGATHHDRMGELPDALPGPRPMFFFAPDRVTKRSADWGREGLEQRLADSWRPYLEWTGTWLQVIHGEGPEALEGAYLDLLDGRIDPAKAHVLSLPR
jgi:hypothetical protein